MNNQKTIEEMQDEQKLVIETFIQGIISTRMRFAAYVEKYELFGILTEDQVEFMNSMGVASQCYIDNKQVNKEQ